MFRFFASTLIFVTFVFGEDLMKMGMPQFGASTLKPPFGVPAGIASFNTFGSTFRPPMAFGAGGMMPQQQGFPSNNVNMNNGMNPSNGMMMPQQPGFPQQNNGMNPMQPFNGMNGGMPINQGPQIGQLAGFTNGFAVPNMMMSPPPTGGMFPQQGAFPGFPGSLRPQFNPISDVTTSPIQLKKRQADPQPQQPGNQIQQQPMGSNGQPQPGMPSRQQQQSSLMGNNNQGTFQKSGMPKTFPDNSQGRFGSSQNRPAMEPKKIVA